MNNKTYWENREKEKLNEQLRDVKKLERELKRAFTKASKDIEKEVISLFIKYSEDNKLSYAEASKFLSSKEFKEWRYDLKEYIKLINHTNDEKLLLELNTLAMKSRISRLEEMLYQVNKYIDETFKNFENGLCDLLEVSVSNSYYKTIYDIHKFTGVGTTFAFVDKSMIEEILSYPWSGLNYSERIWKNRDKLKNVIKEEITQMVIQGRDSKEVAKSVAERMNTSLSNASRLVNTEHAFICSDADIRAYRECDVDKYEILATLDKRTSTICQKLDGEVFNVKDAAVGVNMPPFH
jgi:SPP1 gp7 family putative phage head morphogenesis protein